MIGLTKRVIRQIAGDKRSFMMIVFAPLVILTLLYFLLGPSTYTPTIAIHENQLPPALVSALKEQDAEIVSIPDNTDASQYLADNKDVDAVFSISTSGSSIAIYESTSKSAKALKVIQNAVASLNPSATLTTSAVIGRDNASFFDSMGYIFFGLFSFFLIFLIAGMSLVKERSSGTLERFLMSPIHRSSVIAGYTAGYSVFAVAQAVVMMLFGIYVLDVSCAGNILWAILMMLLLAISAVSMGALVSVFANNELQVVQFIPIAIIPQVFFSGLIPLDTIPYGLGKLGYLTPIFYGCSALEAGHGDRQRLRRNLGVCSGAARVYPRAERAEHTGAEEVPEHLAAGFHNKKPIKRFIPTAPFAKIAEGAVYFMVFCEKMRLTEKRK
ncbi:MAG: ABC transporter permease [Oscillospiraceae bacterium]